MNEAQSGEYKEVLPQFVADELKKYQADMRYFFNYNIDKDRLFTKGYFVVTNDFILLHDPKEGFRKYSYSEISDIKGQTYINCVTIECKLDGDFYELCRAGREYQNEFFNTAAQIKKYQEDKRFKMADTAEKLRCPKCGGYYVQGSEFCANCQDKGKTFKRVLKLLLPYKVFIGISVLLFFVTSFIMLYLPQLERKMIDEYIYPQGVTENHTTFKSLLVIIIAILSLDIATRLLSVIRNIILAKSSSELSHNLRAMVYEKIQQLSISRISKRTSGELINRVMNDTNVLNEFLTYTIPNIIQQAIILIVVSVFIFSYNWFLALIIFLPAPLFLISNRLTWKFMRSLFHKSWQTGSKASSILHDIFSGIRVVKVFGTEKQEIKKYNKAIKAQAEIQQKSEIFYNILNPINWFLFSLGGYFITYYIGNKILGGSMTIGEMNQFNAYVGFVYGPLRYSMWLPRMFANAMTSIGKLFEVIDEKVDVETKTNAISRRLEGNIEFKNTFFGYKKHEPVLKGVSLTVKPGEMIGIVGKSGVGKSTLINLIMRMYDVDEGVIKIDGTDIKDYDPTSLRSQMGVVLQETFLFSGTIYENIAYSKPGCTKDEVIRAAKLANAHQFIMKLPASYNTKIGENGHTVSGGERQRIAIARAILHDPKILILDEATSALDTETEALIQDSLSKLIKNRTTFAIAHRLATLRNATRLIVIDKGTIAESGTHDELMKQKGIYYSLIMAQRQMSKMALSKD